MFGIYTKFWNQKHWEEGQQLHLPKKENLFCLNFLGKLG